MKPPEIDEQIETVEREIAETAHLHSHLEQLRHCMLGDHNWETRESMRFGYESDKPVGLPHPSHWRDCKGCSCRQWFDPQISLDIDLEWDPSWQDFDFEKGLPK